MEREKISVGIFESVAEITGGKAYRDAVGAALAKSYEVEVLEVPGHKRLIPSARISRILEIARIRKAKDVWIRDFYPVIGMSVQPSLGKNIALFLHLYTEGDQADALAGIFEKVFFRNVVKCDCVVTISDFWKDFLSSRGLDDVRVIKSGYKPSDFEFQWEEVQGIREKYGLTQSPIIYIGNCRKSKGVVEAYELLRGQGYTLVTSGEPEVRLPCPNLNLSYREYLLLLKASEIVVTMSKFREGWCRTAHEAMLCKTPVIGSGLGGMAELLRGGNQIICEDISELPRYVKQVIGQRERFAEEGYRFASTFTIERFERQWTEVVADVLAAPKRIGSE